MPGNGTERPAPARTLVTVAEAARLATVSSNTVRRWIAAGRLPTVKIAHQHYMRAADLAATSATADVVMAWQCDRHWAGRRLRAFREAVGWSQLQLAAASGVSHEAISALEGGKRAPHAETVNTLARGLGVEPAQFVGHEPIGLTTLTVSETASRLEVPASRVRTWLKQGHLAGVKVSGQWRVATVVVGELARSGRLRGRSNRLDPRFRG